MLFVGNWKAKVGFKTRLTAVLPVMKERWPSGDEPLAALGHGPLRILRLQPSEGTTCESLWLCHRELLS